MAQLHENAMYLPRKRLRSNWMRLLLCIIHNSKYSDLTSWRDRCGCKPTNYDRIKKNESQIVAKPDHSEAANKYVVTQSTGSPKTMEQHYTVKPRNESDATREEVPRGNQTLGEVNMEATITSDDILRAGGFGARDDLNSFLPAASDLTDFEASLNDACEYEEPQGVSDRPGLGWTTKAGPE
ncbi:hypothetical protein AKJ16_DCAP22837 [Drosera capensis]